MTVLESLRGSIWEERRRRKVFSEEMNLMALIRRGDVQEAVENLLFFASPNAFFSHLEALRPAIERQFHAAGEGCQEHCLRFLADLTLALNSFLPQWRLQAKECHGEGVLSDDQVKAEAAKVQDLAVELAGQTPVVSAKLLAEWRAKTTARLEAEQVSEPQVEARILVGKSIGDYLANIGAELNRSNLRRIAEMRVSGQTLTELSNDYAAFLQYALYLGASFVTCNPPLVDRAWVAEPERWNPVVDGIIAENPKAGGDALARLVTLEVVLANMRLLRPIFLLTEGQMGCVCLQVNPHKHGDAETMISDALFIYERMQARLGGGVPNVVFKLPGTKAGLEACYALTRRGIGVTITVNFGMYQHLPFAQAIREGQSIFSNLVEMNGRLAYPVRDELLAKLDELAARGIEETQVREAAAWAGVAVVKRLYRLLNAKGYDLRRVKPLVASLRIYEGDGYERLPSAFPDITEALGAGIISVFPNIRRAFDGRLGFALDPRRIESPVPDAILETLTHSELFRQAYYVDDRDWLPQGDDHFRPDYELTLKDEAATASWAPVRNTLVQFCNGYDAFVQRILERKHRPDTR
jgi:transaldolase